MIRYENWLDEFYGLKPHRTKHENSFNNIIFSAEFILALQEAGILTQTELSVFEKHVDITATEFGLYLPKSSHDNLTAKITSLLALKDHVRLDRIDLSAAQSGKHPRDRIFYGFLLSKNPLYWLGMPFVMFEILRAIWSKGKTRPDWWEPGAFMFRLKALLGLIKPTRTVKVMGGIEWYYNYHGSEQRIATVQNDGKILNLLRLNALRHFKIFKPFVRYCKRLYVKKYGNQFQSQLLGNYFEEPEHPVRVAFRQLDRLNKTIIDC